MPSSVASLHPGQDLPGQLRGVRGIGVELQGELGSLNLEMRAVAGPAREIPLHLLMARAFEPELRDHRIGYHSEVRAAHDQSPEERRFIGEITRPLAVVKAPGNHMVLTPPVSQDHERTIHRASRLQWHRLRLPLANQPIGARTQAALATAERRTEQEGSK